jgi:hypothetical protein
VFGSVEQVHLVRRVHHSRHRLAGAIQLVDLDILDERACISDCWALFRRIVSFIVDICVPDDIADLAHIRNQVEAPWQPGNVAHAR